MKIIKPVILFSMLIICLNGCSTLGDARKALVGEKSDSKDQFLIKKKEPLTQPPDFNIMPEPGTTVNKTNKKKSTVEKMYEDSKSQMNKSKAKSMSTENSILNKIKK